MNIIVYGFSWSVGKSVVMQFKCWTIKKQETLEQYLEPLLFEQNMIMMIDMIKIFMMNHKMLKTFFNKGFMFET